MSFPSALRRSPCAMLLCIACNSAPDVVAHQEQPTTEPGWDAKLIEGCKPGFYRGSFYGGDPDGGSLTVSGTIEFMLEEQLAGEFLEVKNSVLEGTTDNTEFSFTGKVIQSDPPGCHAGHFTGILIGDLQIGDSPLHFEGPVEGDYGDEAFAGTWTANFSTIPLSYGGKWFAAWTWTMPAH